MFRVPVILNYLDFLFFPRRLNKTFPLAEILFSVFFQAGLFFELHHCDLLWVGCSGRPGLDTYRVGQEEKEGN